MSKRSFSLGAVRRAGLAAVVILPLLFASCATRPPPAAIDYFEGFDRPGKPQMRDGVAWKYNAQLRSVSGWKSLVPGDGFAHLTVDRSRLKARRPGSKYWPFQTILIGPIAPNHMISMRARNTTITGVACFLFTYREKKTFDEIDIEIVPDDTESPPDGHDAGPGRGWTDVRLNTWANAGIKSLLPKRITKTQIKDSRDRRVSHGDGRFHIYAIEWNPDRVRFYIDGILQTTIRDIVPKAPARIIFGMRQAPWSGGKDWKKSQTMLVDWISITPLAAD